MNTTPIATNSHQTIPLAAAPLHAGPAAWVGEDFCQLDVSALITNGRDGYFAFELTGDSALPHIRPGAIVFAHAHAEPRHGDTIVAEVDGLVCLKIFQHSQQGLYLASSNGAQYPPRRITKENSFRILGVYRGHLELAQR